MNKKKFKALERNSVEAKEFEESLIRLAQLAKNKIKFEDFTSRDKCNILDLFVNNERTMLSIYESLFPHRKAALGFTGASAPSHTRDRGLSYDAKPARLNKTAYLLEQSLPEIRHAGNEIEWPENRIH